MTHASSSLVDRGPLADFGAWDSHVIVTSSLVRKKKRAPFIRHASSLDPAPPVADLGERDARGRALAAEQRGAVVRARVRRLGEPREKLEEEEEEEEEEEKRRRRGGGEEEERWKGGGGEGGEEKEERRRRRGGRGGGGRGGQEEEEERKVWRSDSDVQLNRVVSRRKGPSRPRAVHARSDSPTRSPDRHARNVIAVGQQCVVC